MVRQEKSQNSAGEEKHDIGQFVKFTLGDKTKSDVFKGKHFNIAVVCLDDGCEISHRHESCDVFFYVVSGKGIFSVGEKRWDAEPGSMVFSPAGVRGIKCLSRLTVLGIQEPH